MSVNGVVVENDVDARDGDPAAEGRSAAGFRRGIGRKVSTRLFVIALIPLVVLSAVMIVNLAISDQRFDRQLPETKQAVLEESIAEDRGQVAGFLLTDLEIFVGDQISNVVDWSRAEPIRAAAGADRPAANDVADSPIEVVESQFGASGLLDATGRSSSYLRDQIADRPVYAELFFTDDNGFNVGATGPTSDFVQRDEAWWMAAWRDGVFVGPLDFDESAGVASFEVAVRIEDPASGRALGVIKAVVDARGFYEVISRFTDDDEDDLVEVRILDSSGKLLAETATGHDATRVGQQVVFEGDQLSAFQAALEADQDEGFAVLDQLLVGFARSEPRLVVDRLGVEIPNQDLIVLMESPNEAALRPLEGLDRLDSLLERSSQVTLVLIGLVFIVTAIAAAVIARLLAQNLVHPIEQLRSEAERIAERELPAMVGQLSRPGRSGPMPEIRPIEIDADDEVADLASAFNAMRVTAIDLAGEQALGRSRDVANVLVNLGRRNQQLAGRQLQHIDNMERAESNPDTLQSLFQLDQIATRMRRNAESLLVLAGAGGAQPTATPLSVEDVIRAASGEVEELGRVEITSTEPALVKPSVVGDLTHLLAELIENAIRFSPPDAKIEIVGMRGVDDRYTISVIDEGIGMSRQKLAEVNRRISDPAFATHLPANVLGLYVVGRLAERHGIDARLVESATTGVTAKLTLPTSCLLEKPPPRDTGFVPGSLRPAEQDDEAFRLEAATWEPPVTTPRQDPAPVATTAEVVTRSHQPPSIFASMEDDNSGHPIPPYRARPSRRSASDPSPGSSDGNIQVRRRVRRTPDPDEMPGDHPEPEGDLPLTTESQPPGSPTTDSAVSESRPPDPPTRDSAVAESRPPDPPPTTLLAGEASPPDPPPSSPLGTGGSEGQLVTPDGPPPEPSESDPIPKKPISAAEARAEDIRGNLTAFVAGIEAARTGRDQPGPGDGGPTEQPGEEGSGEPSAEHRKDEPLTDDLGPFTKRVSRSNSAPHDLNPTNEEG